MIVMRVLRLRAFCRSRNLGVLLGRYYFSPRREMRQGLLRLPRATPISPHRAGWKWRVNRVTLSRIELEWLVACYHDSARLMPRNVYERLKSLGFVDDAATITSAGKHWLDEWRRQLPD